MLRDFGDEGAYERVNSGTLERLMRHDWPGNVRELKNAVQVAFALSTEGEEIDIAAHLGSLAETPQSSPVLGSNGGGGSGSFSTGSFKGRQFQEAKRDVLAHFERDYFAALAEESKGNVSEMARRAGMERAHVRAYLRRHGILAKGESPDQE
jgi:DNA-binding NtrC family response regulator